MSEELDEQITELEDRLDGALSVAKTALQRANDFEEKNDPLRKRIERHEFRLGEIDLCLPRPTDDYKTLSKDEKVSRVRKELMDRAAASLRGCAKMDYSDVKWSVFDGKPSGDHCYTLMQLAAEDVPGLEIVD